jgi:hypothetical protein
MSKWNLIHDGDERQKRLADRCKQGLTQGDEIGVKSLEDSRNNRINAPVSGPNPIKKPTNT